MSHRPSAGASRPSRPIAKPSLALFAAALAGACVGPGGGPRADLPAPPPPVAQAVPAADPGMTIGRGSVRVALLLPLTAGGNAGAAAAALRNAAELAIEEFQGADLSILVKDDRGTPDGAREAASQAVAEGAELVIGPLMAANVQAAGAVAKAAGRPMIAFSTDANAASRGVYLLSFMPDSDVERIVGFAAARGKRSIAALIPETPYGTVVAGEFQSAAARRGIRVAAVERYSGPTLEAAVKRIAAQGAGVDALFIPEDGAGLGGVAAALAAGGIDPKRVQLLGTGVWNDPRVFALPPLQGGWFAAPDSAGFDAFAGRYRARFGASPTRTATLSYDAVSLAAALVKTQGSARFADATLTAPAGFSGADGVFRFRPEGPNERGLAVLQVGKGAATTISPAPREFAPGT